MAPRHRTSRPAAAWRDLAPCQLRIEHPQFLNSGGFRAALFTARAVIPVTGATRGLLRRFNFNNLLLVVDRLRA